MLYVSLILMISVGSFLPWWGMSLVSFSLGLFFEPRRWMAFQQAVAAGIVWAAWAYIRDGQSYDEISPRLAGTFQLPSPVLVFVLMFVIGCISSFLWFQVGSVSNRLFKYPTES